MARFTDIFQDVTKDGHKIPKENYLPHGRYPIVDQGKEYIAGYSNEVDGLYQDVPAIIFGDHTRIIKYVDTPFFLGADGVKLLKAKIPDANYKFLYYALSHAQIPDTGYNRHFKWLKEIEIRLPDENEQQHIVEVLDKVSDLIAIRRAQLNKLDLLVKSRFVEMFGDPVSNPMGWNMMPLRKRCNIITGNTPPRADKENYGEFIEWIKSDNINTPSTYITKAKEKLSEKGFSVCRFVESGSLLMTCIAGSVNCIGNVAITNRRVAFNQQINAIVPTVDDVLYLYWLIQLSKPKIQSTINKALKGILSKGQLSEMQFPFPPVKLQKQFAGFLEQSNKSKLTIRQSLDKLTVMKQSLMQQYFGA